MAKGGSPKGNNPNKMRRYTDRHYDVGQDFRKEEKTGDYPNYWSYKSRGGSNIIVDDSQEKETVTIQHRSGSAFQIHPDGAMHILAHNSKYEVTFGENRVSITGAQDIVVKGDASLRVFGDYNVTCHRNYNLSVLGDFNMVAKNMNRQVRGNMDTQAKNVNKKVEGSINYQAHGASSYTSKGSTTVASQNDQFFFAGATGVHGAVTRSGDMTLYNEDGDHYVENKNGKYDMKIAQDGQEVKVLHEKGKSDHNADNEITQTSVNKGISVTANQDITHESQTSGIKMKAPQNISAEAGNHFEAKAGADAHIHAGGSAAMEAPTTHVRGFNDTHIQAGTGNVNIDPGSLVTLATGMSMPFGGLGQLSFNFLQNQQAQGIGDLAAKAADRAREEADASGTIKSWDDGPYNSPFQNIA